MNARIKPKPAATAPAHVKRGTGSQPGTPRRLVLGELQHHARNARFSPHNSPPGLSPQQLASATGVDIKQVRAALGTMRDLGQVVNAGTLNKPLWRQHTPADAAQAQAKADRPTYGTGTYDGAELRPYQGRPGAMDAFDSPSLVQGQCVPARRASAQLVGALADRSNNARG